VQRKINANFRDRPAPLSVSQRSAVPSDSHRTSEGEWTALGEFGRAVSATAVAAVTPARAIFDRRQRFTLAPSNNSKESKVMKETTVFAARGAILIPARTIPCRFTQDTIDGCFNGLIEVAADPELLKEIAFSRLFVRVELLDVRFRCAIAGYRKDPPALHLRAVSLHRGLADALNRRSRRDCR
jgi:hypothetical protein